MATKSNSATVTVKLAEAVLCAESCAEQLTVVVPKAKVVGEAKGPKIDGFTYKKRTNQRRRYGHRQKYHVVEITSIKKG